MKKALQQLAPKEGESMALHNLDAAKDLLSNSTRMTDGGRAELQAFIAQYEATAEPCRADTDAEMLALLREHPDTLNTLVEQAFGTSNKVGFVHMIDASRLRSDGNFDIYLTEQEVVGRGNSKSFAITTDPTGAAIGEARSVDGPPVTPVHPG
jgi:ABC-type transporter Mla subunit MlaD